MLAKGDDDGLVLKRQAGGFWLFRAGRKIGHRTALLPFCNGLQIDPIALEQRPQALLTILYCSTDCLCRCGAAVKNLSHSASFHSRENNAPIKPWDQTSSAMQRDGRPVRPKNRGNPTDVQGVIYEQNGT